MTEIILPISIIIISIPIIIFIWSKNIKYFMNRIIKENKK